MGLFLLSLLLLAEVASRLALAMTGNEDRNLAGLRNRKALVAAGELDGSAKASDRARRLTAITALHPFVGFVQTPRAADEGWMKQHHLPINSFGFIDDKPSLQRRAPDRRIVAITGGSVAFYFGSEGVDRLRTRLADLPGFAGREIVFVRLALGGFKEPQQLATLAYLLALGGEFDVLINLDGFNEVALYPIEGAPLRAHPAHPRGWPQMLEVTTSPERIHAVGARAFWSRRQEQWAVRWTGRVLDRSAFLTLLWSVSDGWIARRVDIAEAAFLISTKGGQLSFSATGPPTQFSGRPEMFAELAAIWERSSLQLARLCRANDIAYFHFLQPNQYVAGSKPMGPEEQRLAVSASFPHAANVVEGYPLLIEAGARLQASGVDFTDLTQLFAKVDEPVYKDPCCHLNLEGNLRLADAIADRIAAAAPAAGLTQGTTELHSPNPALSKPSRKMSNR